jgi:hypothetical protein
MDQTLRESLQGRLVPDEPQVAERVDEAALPVKAPRHLMVTDLVDAAVRAGCHGPFDESIGVVSVKTPTRTVLAPVSSQALPAAERQRIVWQPRPPAARWS